MSKLTTISTVLATWVGVVSAITGGYFALQAYRADVDKKVGDRALVTFELISQFRSSDMRAVRDPILIAAQNIQSCRPIPLEAAATDLQLFTFVEFFDVVQSCVEANLCEPKLTKQYFSPYANGHLEPLRDHIAATRRTEDSQGLPRPYGWGLEQLANAPTKIACR